MSATASLAIIGAVVLLDAAIGWAQDVPTRDLARGARVYTTHCASCHGTDGDGKGPAWLRTIPRPQVFMNANYMERLSERYLFEVVKYGKLAVVKGEVAGSTIRSLPMPPFGEDLSDAQVRELLAFQRTLRGSGVGSARTRAIFEENCIPCHGPHGRGDGRMASKRQPAPPKFVSAIQPAPADITDPLFMNRFSDEFLFTLIRKGWIGAIESGRFTTMGPFGDVLSDEDIWSVVGYIGVTFVNGKTP